jgi:hypothetical protein
MDDVLIGIGVGLLVLLYERRQRQNIIRKLEVIRLMNHHVRNSLQVISFAASVPQDCGLMGFKSGRTSGQPPCDSLLD